MSPVTEIHARLAGSGRCSMRIVDTAVTCGLLLGALLACKAGAQEKAKDEKPVVVRATELFDDYHRNEVAADERYKGKLVRVVGVVQSLDKDAFDNIVVRLQTSNQFQSVMASMKDAEKSKVASMTKGQAASLECRGRGMVIGSPSLGDCTVLGTGGTK
jgi:hypothetical protein